MVKGNGADYWASKQVFTTGEAAEICKVSQQTIIRCFDSGRLNGFRVPGSKFRRIPRIELLRFMRTNDITTDLENPPPFDKALEANADRDMDYPEDFKSIVQEKYADLAPLMLEESPERVFQRTLELAEAPRACFFGAERAILPRHHVNDAAVGEATDKGRHIGQTCANLVL